MEITEIKVYPVKDSGRLKAYATLVFDDCFIIRDLKVIEGPSYKFHCPRLLLASRIILLRFLNNYAFGLFQEETSSVWTKSRQQIRRRRSSIRITRNR